MPLWIAHRLSTIAHVGPADAERLRAVVDPGRAEPNVTPQRQPIVTAAAFDKHERERQRRYIEAILREEAAEPRSDGAQFRPKPRSLRSGLPPRSLRARWNSLGRSPDRRPA